MTMRPDSADSTGSAHDGAADTLPVYGLRLVWLCHAFSLVAILLVASLPF